MLNLNLLESINGSEWLSQRDSKTRYASEDAVLVSFGSQDFLYDCGPKSSLRSGSGGICR